MDGRNAADGSGVAVVDVVLAYTVVPDEYLSVSVDKGGSSGSDEAAGRGGKGFGQAVEGDVCREADGVSTNGETEYL